MELASKSNQRNLTRCKHFNGIQNKECEAGIPYDQARGEGGAGLACLPSLQRLVTPGKKAPECCSYAVQTEEELDAEQAEFERVIDCVVRGVSQCCQAPIDKSQMHEHRGALHGRATCPACGKTVLVA